MLDLISSNLKSNLSFISTLFISYSAAYIFISAPFFIPLFPISFFISNFILSFFNYDYISDNILIGYPMPEKKSQFYVTAWSLK